MSRMRSCRNKNSSQNSAKTITTTNKKGSNNTNHLPAVESTEKEEPAPEEEEDSPYVSRPKKRSKSRTAAESAWSELYDRNISGKKEELPLVIADKFMEFCGSILNRDILLNVINAVRENYQDNNYHNFEHACHVFLNCAFMLNEVVTELSLLEQFSLLYAALIHDAGHLGVPNLELIQSCHPLALKFHDQSVAEMNSLTVGLELLAKPGMDLLEKLSEEDRVIFRKNVIDIVLATDVADTYKKRLIYLKLEDNSDEDVGLDTTTPAGRLALLCIIMRACDVASSMQSITTSEIWSRNFFLEVSLASYDTEEILREESKKYFNGQIIYMEGHSLILIVKLQTTQALKPEFTDILLQNFQTNLSNWREHGLSLLDSWTAMAIKNMKTKKDKNNRLRRS